MTDFGNVQHLQNTVTTQEVSCSPGFTLFWIVILLINLTEDEHRSVFGHLLGMVRIY